MGKNNAQNHINIKTFFTVPDWEKYWQFHNFKPSKKYLTNESKFFFFDTPSLPFGYVCSQAIRINMWIISTFVNWKMGFFLNTRLSCIVFEIKNEVHIPKRQVMKNGDPITYINDQFDHIVNIINLKHIKIHSNDDFYFIKHAQLYNQKEYF